jgi:hypothetical protein
VKPVFGFFRQDDPPTERQLRRDKTGFAGSDILTSAHLLPHREKADHPRSGKKDTAIQRSASVYDQWNFLTTNKTNFQAWGAASPENFIFGPIRVYSQNSWFKCPALGHPSRRGSLVFAANQDV